MTARTHDRIPHGTLDALAAGLLARSGSIVYGPTARALVAKKRILVTGAGGSIGSEIVRQLGTLHPQVVYLLDHDESALHALQLQMHGHGLLDDDRTILADVRDRVGMVRVMREVRPDIVYHAAAHKHLPLVERYPTEGVKTNVLGTDCVVSAAVEAGAKLFVNISTDKAARPTSVLGATKRLAEMIVSDHAGRGTRVASVRFGNVLGSRGSFLESLSFQIANGGPVTVTDSEATRFFMTIPEAAGLVIETSGMAQHGETYLLDMGEPLRIIDLVQRFVTLTGAAAPELLITGLRPGEKLHEQLFDASEVRLATPHSRIWVVRGKEAPPARLRERVEGLCRLALEGRVDRLVAELSALLPEDIDACPSSVLRLPDLLAPNPARAASLQAERQPHPSAV